jgi:hypothetical protein
MTTSSSHQGSKSYGYRVIYLGLVRVIVEGEDIQRGPFMVTWSFRNRSKSFAEKYSPGDVMPSPNPHQPPCLACYLLYSFVFTRQVVGAQLVNHSQD